MKKATAVPSANARVVHIEIRQAAVVRKFLSSLENIANTANCVDQWSWFVMIYLAAQTIDMDIHNISCGINPHPPDMVQNHSTSYHTTFVAAQIFQEGKLLWGQLQHLIAPPRFPAHQVKLEVGSLQAD